MPVAGRWPPRNGAAGARPPLKKLNSAGGLPPAHPQTLASKVGGWVVGVRTACARLAGRTMFLGTEARAPGASSSAAAP